MARFNCLVALLVGKKKKSKDSPTAVEVKKGNDSWNQNKALEDLIINTSVGKGVGFEPLTAFGAQEKVSTFNEKFVEDDNLVGVEAAYEGGDEHDEILSMKRDFSDFDLQVRASENEEFKSHGSIGSNPRSNEGSDRDEVITPELMIQSGHVSDPGMHRATAFLGSPMLKRSCSNIETKRANRPLIMSPAKSQSYVDLKNLSGSPLNRIPNSPLSVMTNYSADKVMLKKRSSSQVLPSRSRKIWWKLFLWSHRNLHNPLTVKPKRLASIQSVSNKKDGYCSDTLEPRCAIDKMNKKPIDAPENENQIDLWPQNQWVAFSAESSSLDRVNAWVNSLEISQIANDEDDDAGPRDAIVFPCTPEIGESSGKNHTHGNRRAVEEIMQANNIIQSLNTFSSVAHIAGMGLKVIPAISAFSSLRSVNLAGNFIVHITPGSLPKSLHTLDLSRNKITTIEGLRDLTRLRVLNLSYNRISRIGHGLSNCTLIKELYLAGNKISDVEGLHRLLKLTVLDLSFNKITTAKSLGQLVANYHSLLALNLLGNPIQTNIGDDHLRKSVTGLLPQLTYLNRQPVKPQRAREAATDSVARAALGNGGSWSSRRRTVTRRAVGHGSSPSLKDRDGPKSSNRVASKSRHQSSPSLRK